MPRRSGSRAGRWRLARCSRRGWSARSTSAGRRANLHRHRQLRLRLGRQPDRQRDARGARQPRVRVRAAPSAAELAAGRVRGHARRRRRPAVHRLLGRRRQLEGVRRRDAARPRRLANRRPARRGHHRRHVTASLPGPAPTVFSGRHVGRRAVDVLRGREVHIKASRPFTLYADGDPIAELPATVQVLPAAVRMIVPAMTMLDAKIAAARAVGELARRAGRGGGTSLPGKVLIALEPDAISRARGAPAARLGGDLGHQRQDDDGRDGRLGAEARRRARSSTTAPARTWPAASPRRCSPRREAADGSTGELGLFEIDEFWLDRVVPELQAARDPARQPVPRPARPLRRARDDRRPLGGGDRDGRGRRRSSC